MEVVYSLEYSPAYIEGLVFEPALPVGSVKIAVRKTNGVSLGSVTLSREQLLVTLDLLEL